MSSSLVNETQRGIYPPPRFWRLDPVYRTNVKIFIRYILNFKMIQFTEEFRTVQGFFFRNHPVKNVEIIAPITGIEIIGNSIIKYRLEDGSARIDCVNFGEDGKYNKYVRNPKFDFGTLVKVIGRINEYNGKREIIFNTGNIWVIKDPNEELLRWLEILKLVENVYSKPFILPNNANLTDDISDKEETDEDNAEFIDVSDKEETDEDNAELNNNEALHMMSTSEERLDEDNADLINDDAPLIMSILEKKSDENMPISSSLIFKRMKISEDSSSQITEDMFINSITRYIYKNHLYQFSPVRVCLSTELNDLAKKVIPNLSTKPKSRAVYTLFTDALEELVREGFLIRVDAISYFVHSQFENMVKNWKNI
ncbi:7195_t:CDS:2 [Cetraspora pellucida]|uniref:CST complex subunit STN1 n=1 Tax=Cetraspora pellucida TaxID=1433469 RepID=A0A9N9I6G8_9GLOM|nr:7195_t:CDS:2 [Cetraspora pellucida]